VQRALRFAQKVAFACGFGEENVINVTILRLGASPLYGPVFMPRRDGLLFWIYRTASILILSSAWCAATAAAQSSTQAAHLPDAPEPQAAVQENLAPAAGTATIGGTVLDPNGNAVPDAHVRLEQEGSSTATRETDTTATGGFVFGGIAPGNYRVQVSGTGLTNYVSGPVVAQADQPTVLPNIVLSVAAASTSVTVLDTEAASIEQEHIAEQQRVFGVFNNFYSSFDWNAPPMMPRQKFRLAIRTAVDPVSFLITAGIAGAEQYRNVFPSFGGGWEGYGKRYAAAFAGHMSGEMFTRAIYPSIFHQDPRYFVMEKGSGKSRAWHAVSSTFVTRTDTGGHRFNYSEVLGDFSAGALAVAYYPPDERGVHVFLINGFGDIAGDAIDNLFREFVFNKVTRRAKEQQP
jgi:hypothetical protein